MASRRRTITLLVVVLGLGGALLTGDALPQGYQTRFARSHRCQTCPRDCSEKLSGVDTAEIFIDYPPPNPWKPKYQLSSGGPHPTPAPYVINVLKPQTQYSALQLQLHPQYSAPQSQPQYPAYLLRLQPQHSVPPPQPQHTTLQLQPQNGVPPLPQIRFAVSPPRPAQPSQSTEKPPVYPTNFRAGVNRQCDCPDCQPDFDPSKYPGCDYDEDDAGYRYGRSLDDGYPMFDQYNRKSVDDNGKKEYSRETLPFPDESGPPADFYKNYRPYEGESIDRHEHDFEERPSRRGPDDNKRERLFVVYRADADDDTPSDIELESVIRQAMDVARQQKSQENFAKARKPKSVDRFHYEHEKYQNDGASEPVEFEPLKEDKTEASNDQTRFNLSPGPLMNDETFVSEDGDDTLNPGTDQSKWTVVPSLSELELAKPQVEDIEEIEAAVSVVPKMAKARNIMKVPKFSTNGADVGDVQVKNDAAKVSRVEEVEKKTDLMEDVMQTPAMVTETTKFAGPIESTVTWAPTTNVSVSQ